MNLVDRVKNIITNPKGEWGAISAEETTTRDLFMNYILPLAAIGPVASLIGMSLFGIGGLHLPFGSALVHALVSYVLGLVGVYVVAWIINALATNFGGEKNSMQALKVAAYASTPAWVGGIFSLIPAIAILGSLAGLYSLYLLYLGLPVLMHAPHEKALPYTIVVIVAAVAVFIVMGLLSSVFLFY